LTNWFLQRIRRAWHLSHTSSR